MSNGHPTEGMIIDLYHDYGRWRYDGPWTDLDGEPLYWQFTRQDQHHDTVAIPIDLTGVPLIRALRTQAQHLNTRRAL